MLDQAVALRSGSDLSAFYQCSFVGYQDTLYVHSLGQFYRECDVYGTVDFIFGNAVVVFQNCALYARKPNENQKNIFTAQGREDPNQNTGISIMNSKLAAASDLIPVQSSFKSYIGRPWKLYSRTVILQSNIGDLVEPVGWRFCLVYSLLWGVCEPGSGLEYKYELCFSGEKIVKTATAALANPTESERSSHYSNGTNAEKGSTKFDNSRIDVFRWSRCKKPLPQQLMLSIGIPLPLENVEHGMSHFLFRIST
ncbi:Pectinesterase [Heracleum sosnowskyi]|uniref:Pectinesterase n=1 Tax=Heracleum sosnowskyi TaxID=360622 RepID=A0AAD8HH87_9APIA|nr:Pectinesterase [Heracleum sosnowskyi]